MRDRRGEAAFATLFGAAPDVSADAPGRVNLMGEHTDYHCGFVLPTVLPQTTEVLLRRREDRTVRAYSATLGGEADTFRIGTEQPGRGWLDYVQGVTCVLREHAVLPPGFDVRIESSVPTGAGVGSSAALVVSLLRALRELCDLPLDGLEIARLAQRVETHFVGAPVGIMDPIACSLGRSGEVLFVDTRDRSYDRVDLPETAELAVIGSGVVHRDAACAYMDRRRESFAAASALGVAELRDVGLDALPDIERLPDPLARRARHVVTENQRVLETVDALQAGDLEAVGRLFAASHASMRDDCEITTAEIDALVDLACDDAAVHGARMTGGGFGGAVVILAAAGQGRAAADRVAGLYERRTGRTATVLTPAAAGIAFGAA
jgi:galactokinase